jgi:hypothetical protein
MPDATTITHRRCRAAGLILLGAFSLGVAGPDVGIAASSAVACKSADLVYKRTDQGVRYTARASALRSRYFSCAAARDVAAFITKGSLFGREVTQYRNFTITAKAIGPDSHVRATRPVGDGRVSVVTFTIKGGR